MVPDRLREGHACPSFLCCLKRAVCDVFLMRMSGPRGNRVLNRPLLLPTAMATHRERPGQSKVQRPCFHASVLAVVVVVRRIVVARPTSHEMDHRVLTASGKAETAARRTLVESQSLAVATVTSRQASTHLHHNSCNACGARFLERIRHAVSA